MIPRKHVISGCAGLLLLTTGTAAWSDFTGGYAGGAVGLFTSATLEESYDGGDVKYGSGIEDMLTKFDVLVGFGMQQDRAYFGIEGQYTLVNNLDGTIFSSPVGSEELEAGDGWAVAARIGYVPESSILLYGKVGYGQRNYELSVPGGSDDEDFSGPGFGVGIEYMATENVSVRLEGMRYDYSSEGEGDVEFDPVEQTVDLAAVVRF